ncbi:MAG: LysR family transcriptional regulator [Legionella sp.]
MHQRYTQLVAFYYIAHFLSITKAAKYLLCSKAHISKQLSDLERIAGTSLIHRNTRTLKLTFAGESIFQHAQSIINELHHVENTISALQNKVQ